MQHGARLQKNTKLLCMSEEERNNDLSMKSQIDKIHKTLFKYGLYEYLAPKRCIYEYKLDYEFSIIGYYENPDFLSLKNICMELEKIQDYDLVLITRGGGSFTDLFGFSQPELIYVGSFKFLIPDYLESIRLRASSIHISIYLSMYSGLPGKYSTELLRASSIHVSIYLSMYLSTIYVSAIQQAVLKGL